MPQMVFALAFLTPCMAFVPQVPLASMNTSLRQGTASRRSPCSTPSASAEPDVQTSHDSRRPRPRIRPPSRPARPPSKELTILLETLQQPGTINNVRVRDLMVDTLSRRPSGWKYQELAETTVRFGSLDLVQKMVRASIAEGHRVNVHSVNRLINGAARERRWDMVTALWEFILDLGLEPNHLTHPSALSAMAKLQLHDHIENLLESGTVPKTLGTYNAIISGCVGSKLSTGSSSTFETCSRYFDSMNKAGVRPSDMTFSSLIAATRDSAVGVNVQAAEKLIRTMSSEWDVAPDIYCLNCLMAVQLAGKCPERALAVFCQMESKWGVQPDTVSLNTAIDACDKLADGTKALALLRAALKSADVGGPAPDVISFNSAISALGRCGRWTDALDLFNFMVKEGDAITPNTITHNSIISACARAGEFDIAMAAYDAMEKRGLQRNEATYGAALHAALRARSFERALSILETLERTNIRASRSTYATVVCTCVRSGHSEVALEIFRKAVKRGAVPTGGAVRELVEGCDALGLEDEVRELLQTARIDIPPIYANYRDREAANY